MKAQQSNKDEIYKELKNRVATLSNKEAAEVKQFIENLFENKQRN